MDNHHWGSSHPPRWWAKRIMDQTDPESKQRYFDEVPEHLREIVRTHCYTTRDRRISRRMRG